MGYNAGKASIATKFGKCLKRAIQRLGIKAPKPFIQKHRAEEFWQERVFALLLDTHKIDEQTAGSMRGWRHSGFSVDTSVRIEGNDQAAM